MSAKIGKIFLSLIDKHFPKHHGYSKIFNRNTVKVSYCCTKNMKNNIQSHNKKILHSNNTKANKNTEFVTVEIKILVHLTDRVS